MFRCKSRSNVFTDFGGNMRFSLKHSIFSFIFLIVGTLGTSAFAAQRSVWIDTDLGIGKPSTDGDDGYATLYALLSPELSILGISTVFGNTLDLPYQVKTAHEMVTRFAK